jgi:hypothetical protein
LGNNKYAPIPTEVKIMGAVMTVFSIRLEISVKIKTRIIKIPMGVIKSAFEKMPEN